MDTPTIQYHMDITTLRITNSPRYATMVMTIKLIVYIMTIMCTLIITKSAQYSTMSILYAYKCFECWIRDVVKEFG